MRQTLASIMDVLDEGLRLYRRNFTRFLLLAVLVAVPLGGVTVVLFLAADWFNSGWGALLMLLTMLVGLPLSLYVMGALSRAAVASAAGAAVSVRHSLVMNPLRVLGMGCYGTLFLAVAGTMVSIVSSVCFCGAYLVVVAGFLSIASVTQGTGPAGEAAAGLAIAVGVFAIVVVYLATLVVNGAVYGSAVYAMQPFVQDSVGMGVAVQRSIDLAFYRFGQNLLAFFCASLVFGAVALAATLGIGVLVPLPALFLLGAESPVAQAISAAAWVAGLTAASPLLPIWMALLYRRRRAEREGEDLAARLAILAATP